MAGEAIISISLVLVINMAVLLLVVALARLIARGPEYPMKTMRYEAGNPPKGRARSWLPMQYYGYLIIFLAFEPILALIFLFPYYGGSILNMFYLFLAIIGIATPPFIYAVRQAGNIDLWRFRKPEEA